MVAYIRAKGKQVISWNPGWKYKPGEIDMEQMWSYRGKARPGIPAIDSRFHYINHFDTFADLIGLYTSRITMNRKEVMIWRVRSLPYGTTGSYSRRTN